MELLMMLLNRISGMFSCLKLKQEFAGHAQNQSMEWTGLIHWIHNPVQSRRIWIGLDQKFTNLADSGLDWIDKCAMCIPYLEIWGNFSLS